MQKSITNEKVYSRVESNEIWYFILFQTKKNKRYTFLSWISKDSNVKIKFLNDSFHTYFQTFSSVNPDKIPINIIHINIKF